MHCWVGGVIMPDLLERLSGAWRADLPRISRIADKTYAWWVLTFSLFTGLSNIGPVQGSAKAVAAAASWYMGHILWVCIAGFVIGSCKLLISWRVSSLEREGTSAPCVQSLVARARDDLFELDESVKGCRFVLYRFVGGELCPFWADPIEGLDLAEITAEDEGLPLFRAVYECWDDNKRAMKPRHRTRGVQRKPVTSWNCKANNETSAYVNVPIIVSEYDRHPWGVLHVRITPRIDSVTGNRITDSLNADLGLVDRIETLLRTQRERGHFLRLDRV